MVTPYKTSAFIMVPFTVGNNNELRALIPEAIEVVGKTINVNRVKGRFRFV